MWLIKLGKGITRSEKAARTARDKRSWSGWPATVARYCGKIVTGIQGGKLSTAKKIQFLQAPVASFDCELLSFSTVKVRLMAPLNRIACLFLSLQFSEHWSLWFSNISASIHYNLYFNSPIHTCLCIPSDGFTYCTYPHALGQLLPTIKWQYRRK